MKISAVIPTRNRASYVEQLLVDLQQQTYALAEIIIVDSSDDIQYKHELVKKFSSLPLRWLDSEASVCIQRNKGIKAASFDWIFLCDDDMKLPSDYIEKLVSFMKEHATCCCVSGLSMEGGGKELSYDFSFKKFSSLLWAYLFKLTVWGSVDKIETNSLFQPVYKVIGKFYTRKGNTLSSAGWPVITQFQSPYFKTKIYPLGASLVKKEWLLNSPYDEVLDPNGLGDNYGVALGFPEEQGIYVLHATASYNIKAKENRMEYALAYFRRVLALHYFLNTHKAFTARNRRLFTISLLANLLQFVVNRNISLLKANAKALLLIFTKKNPYIIGKREGRKTVTPQYSANAIER